MINRFNFSRQVSPSIYIHVLAWRVLSLALLAWALLSLEMTHLQHRLWPPFQFGYLPLVAALGVIAVAIIVVTLRDPRLQNAPDPRVLQQRTAGLFTGALFLFVVAMEMIEFLFWF